MCVCEHNCGIYIHAHVCGGMCVCVCVCVGGGGGEGGGGRGDGEKVGLCTLLF